MKINGPGIAGNRSRVVVGGGGGTTCLSECCAGLTELCLAFRGDECRANFLQPFQTGLDNNVFDSILEATGDAIIEPWTAVIASVPQRAKPLEFCHHLPSVSLCTRFALFSLPRLAVFVTLHVHSQPGSKNS